MQVEGGGVYKPAALEKKYENMVKNSRSPHVSRTTIHVVD
jgi:hypothetical protein